MDVMKSLVSAPSSAVDAIRKALGPVGGFQTGTSWATSYLPRSNFDYASTVKDGSASSIVGAVVGWICRTWPEAALVVRELDAEQQWTVIRDHEALARLERPNPFYTGSTLWMATLASFIPTGNAYWLKQRNVAGNKVVAYWWIPNWMIEPKWPESGDEFISHYEYRPSRGGDAIRKEVNDVVHFRWGLDPNNYRMGLGPIGSLVREIFTDDEAANYTAAILRNLGIPGLIIWADEDTMPADEEEANEARERWADTFRGDNRGLPMIPSFRGKVEKLSFSPDELNLRDLRRIPEERVSAVLGIPAIVAGLGAGLDRSTFSNMAEAREAAYESGIIPIQRLLAGQLDLMLLADFGAPSERQRFYFDNSEVRVLQEDANKKAETLGSLFYRGVLTRGQVKAPLGMPVDDAADDVYLLPMNLVEVPRGDTSMQALPAGSAPPAGIVETRGRKAFSDRVRHRRERSMLAATQRIAFFLQSQAERVADRIMGTAELRRNGTRPGFKAPADELMSGELDEIRRLVLGISLEAVEQSFDESAEVIGAVDLDFDPAAPSVVSYLDEVGTRIVGIDETTRQMVADRIAIASERGYTRSQIVNGVPEDDFPALRDMPAFNAARAERIARTEITIAENRGAVAAWRDSGLVEQVEILDGDGCGWTSHDDPDLAHGTTRTLADFDANPLAHPNCVRIGTPIVTSRRARRQSRAIA